MPSFQTKVYIYPPIPSQRSENYNPYVENFVEALGSNTVVINRDDISRVAVFNMARYILTMKICVFNWIENLPVKKLGYLQTFFFLFFLFPILKLRKVQIIWIFHNFGLHNRDNVFSAFIRGLMLRHSMLIVTHSKAAYNELSDKCGKRIIYFAHPLKKGFDSGENTKKTIDILIWGKIEPYKGILDFLQFLHENSLASHFKIFIVGKCDQKNYLEKILSFCNSEIHFENRSASMDELRNLIATSRYVLFPYVDKFISSSGALMDTLMMRGIAIGPDKGAFLDCAEEGVSFVFKQFEDVIYIIKEDKIVKEHALEEFLIGNSWDEFGKKLAKEIISLKT